MPNSHKCQFAGNPEADFTVDINSKKEADTAELDRLILWFLPLARFKHEVRLASRVFDSAGDEGRRLAYDANERFVAPKPEARPHGGLVLIGR